MSRPQTRSARLAFLEALAPVAPRASVGLARRAARTSFLLLGAAALAGCQATGAGSVEGSTDARSPTAQIRANALPAADAERAPQPEGAGDGAQSARANASAPDFAQLAGALDLAALEEGHRVLGQELIARWEDLADSHRASADPAAALPYLDRALRIEPGRRSLHLARAEALVDLGDQLRAEGQSGVYISGSYDDARRAYDQAGRSPRVLLGASHAAWLSGDGASAHTLAKEALSRLADAHRNLVAGGSAAAAVAPSDVEVAPFGSPARIAAQGASLAFAQAVQQDAAVGRRAALEAEARTAIDRLIGEAPEDMFAWNSAIDFELWRGEHNAALDVLLAGIEQAPGEAALEARLVNLATGARGATGAADLLVELANTPDASPGLAFEAAKAQFEAALLNLPAPGNEPQSYPEQLARFSDAEVRFAKLSAGLLAGDPRAVELAGWRTVARLGRGWVEYAQLDLEQAAATFFSANEILPRGVEWQVEGRMRSGLIGLQLVAERLQRRGSEQLAADTLWHTHLLAPSDPMLASNAGLFLRDLGANMEAAGRLLCRLANGELDAPQARDAGPSLRALADLAADGSQDRTPAAKEAANTLIARGVEATERCFRAYEAAIAASPDDPWILRDAALVLVYSLHRDLDRAVQWFERAIELAEPLARAAEAGTEGRGSITEVWGDAHENLGVYHLNFTGDLEQAVIHLRKAVEIGPMPEIDRPWVRALIAAYDVGDLETVRTAQDVRSFGQPCP